MIDNRYRIVGLLGRGGMGEVYRADDLKLEQDGSAEVPARRAWPAIRRPSRSRFHERGARSARQVSHPGTSAGSTTSARWTAFTIMSMEYVDGEDLASLVLRIGRLPGDKAVQIARQLCAGLAAAHARGILHRDLKPANVMLDGRGGARITDFGLAGLEDSFRHADVRSGTPAYMSPEQIAGKEVTVRSDIYALGLVLYEVFTGKRVYDAQTPAELSSQRESAPTSPSSHVEEMDPVVERVILRCLEKNPQDRPPTAAAVAAALPGGDPLAAALAAGETPSPELVAAAGTADAMHPGLALGLLVVTLGLFGLSLWAVGGEQLRAFVPLIKTPAAMADRAHEVIEKLGYVEPMHANPTDSAFGYMRTEGWIDWIREHDDSPARWERLKDPQPAAVAFWYRQGPDRYFTFPTFGSIAPGRVSAWNPRRVGTGETYVSLDARGRLRYFSYNPRRFSREAIDETAIDWGGAFELAGLEMSAFTPVESRVSNFFVPERRVAWIGTHPEVPDIELRIEAGASDGKVVLFILLWPWELDTLAEQPSPRGGAPTQFVIFWGINLLVIAGGGWLARRNLKRGRADRRGAMRVAWLVFLLTLLWEILRAHGGMYTFTAWPFFVLGSGTLVAAITAVFYLALEPIVRRVWPGVLVSWSKCLSGVPGWWRDPLVGRSVLIGLAVGAIAALAGPLQQWLLSWVEGAPAAPATGDWEVLLGQRLVLAALVKSLSDGIGLTFFVTMFLVLVRVVVRHQLLAAVLVVAIIGALGGAGSASGGEAAIKIGVGVLLFALLVSVLLRWGMLALVCAAIPNLLVATTATHTWGDWHSRPAIASLVFVGALAAYGFWAASRGRSLVREEG